ncbi:MAG: N-acetyltransferase [Anaerolineales bacterium]
MNFTITPIAQLDPAGLARLAALHQPVMRTLLSDLGLPVVQRYYEVCQQDPSVVGFCAISTNGEALGWAVGCSHPDEINARLRAPLAWFAGQMLRLACTRPAVLTQLAQSVLSASDANVIQPGQIELTYIGVAPSARGQGLGKALLAAFVDASRIAGYHSVALSVETDNPEAIALYRKAGFKIIKNFQEGRFVRHRMELAFPK